MGISFDRQKISMAVMTGFLIIPVIIFTVFMWHENTLSPYETGVVDNACNVHESSCEARFNNGGKLIFSISPRPVKPLTSLALKVELSGVNAQQVKVDFQGIGIDMGFYRPELKADSENHFSGEASLSVCTLDKMLWQATVILKSDKGSMIAPFRFEVDQP